MDYSTTQNWKVIHPCRVNWHCEVAPRVFWNTDKAPNAFHRLMQRLVFGFNWKRV